MKDKDTQLIFEAYSESSTGSMTRDDPRYEQLVMYYMQSDGASKEEAMKMARETIRRMNAKKLPVVNDDSHEEKAWEIAIRWPNVYGSTSGISDMHWNSVEPPTEEDIANWIKEKWPKHGEILSNMQKEKIPDPMKFELKVLGTYGKDEDRGAVGFKKGGSPLHGG